MNGTKAARPLWGRLGTRRRWGGRFGLIAALVIVLSGLLVPGPAQAGDIVPCPATITQWRRVSVTGRPPVTTWEGYRFTTLSVTPQFFVSTGRVLDNSTDLPVNYTVTSSVSQTFSVSATVGITANPTDYLTTSVSTTIVASRTTSIGVSVTVPVPARTRLIAEYGVEGYNVSYGVEAWRVRKVGGNGPPPVTGDQCEEWGWYPQNTNAPTYIEGWRLRTG